MFFKKTIDRINKKFYFLEQENAKLRYTEQNIRDIQYSISKIEDKLFLILEHLHADIVEQPKITKLVIRKYTGEGSG